jgi:drug/metabolite transporter (DMT)-like permease
VSAGLASLCGGILLAGYSLFSGEIGDADWTTDALLALGYLIVVGSFVGFTAYVWLLRVAPISLVSTYAYVNPIVAVALGWLILGEEITMQMAIAGAAVLVSVAVILRAGGASLEPGRGLFTRRAIAAAAATEPTA